MILVCFGCSLKLSENSHQQTKREISSVGSCYLVKDRYEDVYQIQRKGEAIDTIWYDYAFAQRKLHSLETTTHCQ